MARIRSIFGYLLLMVGVAALIIACNSQPDTTTAPETNETEKVEVSNENKININTAILSELDQLEAELEVTGLSNKIEENRPYGSTEDLVSKNVLTQEQFERIKDRVTIEEVVLTGVAKDLDYLTKLGLMKGHMTVAGELLELDKPEQADPHLGHPVEEIYADIEGQLDERNVAQFSNVLNDVQALVKSNPKSPEVKTDYDKAMATIQEAIDALPESQRNSPEFVLQAMNGILDAAGSEYETAISEGKIGEVIEYQDSRGFVLYAKDTLYKNIESQLEANQPELEEQLDTALEELFQAWPSAVAPATPVVSAADVTAKIEEIEKINESIVKS